MMVPSVGWAPPAPSRGCGGRGCSCLEGWAPQLTFRGHLSGAKTGKPWLLASSCPPSEAGTILSVPFILEEKAQQGPEWWHPDAQLQPSASETQGKAPTWTSRLGERPQHPVGGWVLGT